MTTTLVEAAMEPKWLLDVRLRATRRVLFLRHSWDRSAYPDEHMLAIGHGEVDRALEPPGMSRLQEALFYDEDPQAATVTAALEDLAGQPQDPRWEHLVATLGISPAEQALLALAAATSIDPQLTRVFGYLRDSTIACGASPVLVYDLYSDLELEIPDERSALVRWRLAQPVHTHHSDRGIDASTVFEPDPDVVRALFDPHQHWGLAWDTSSFGIRIDAPPDGGLRRNLVSDIAQLVLTLAGPFPAVGTVPTTVALDVELVGPKGSGRRTLAASVAALFNLGLVAVDGRDIADSADPTGATMRTLRQAALERAALAIENPQSLPRSAVTLIGRCPLIFSCVDSSSSANPSFDMARPGQFFTRAHSGESHHPADSEIPPPKTPSSTASSSTTAGSTTSAHSTLWGGMVRRSFVVPPLDRRQRMELWSCLNPGPAPQPVSDWALRPSEIVAAAQVAEAGSATVTEVCRRMLIAETGELLQVLPTPYTWDDLVLSPVTSRHLRELEAQVANSSAVLDHWGLGRLSSMGRGTSALLAGPSGTGKTMAAQVLARSLGLDCLRVDLAGVVSKYIGETEKHLRQVFDTCERSPSLLFFDEADALFGRRTQVTDAHDRFANIEIDYVLQAMERFDGLAILATNRKGDLDPAFVRRLRFIIDFAPPTAAEREHLWRLCLEEAKDRDGRSVVGELDFVALGKELDLTGAGIKSASLAAAYLADSEGSLIENRHVVDACRRELEKQGLVVRPGQLERR